MFDPLFLSVTDDDGDTEEDEFMAAFPLFLERLGHATSDGSASPGAPSPPASPNGQQSTTAAPAEGSDGATVVAGATPELEPEAPLSEEEQVALQRAAVTWQTMWRGFLVRKEARMAKAALDLIRNGSHHATTAATATATAAAGNDDGDNDDGYVMPGGGKAVGVLEPEKEPENSPAELAAADAEFEVRLKLRKRLEAILAEQHKTCRRATRPSWWIYGQNHEHQFATKAEAETEIARRQNLMLRRSTMEYYYSAEQVEQIVNVVPAGSQSSGWHRVETLVTLFSRITDIEACPLDTLLNFSTYDDDGNHLVSLEELEAMKVRLRQIVVIVSSLLLPPPTAVVCAYALVLFLVFDFFVLGRMTHGQSFAAVLVKPTSSTHSERSENTHSTYGCGISGRSRSCW